MEMEVILLASMTGPFEEYSMGDCIGVPARGW